MQLLTLFFSQNMGTFVCVFPFFFYARFLVFPLNFPKWNWDVSIYVNIKVIIISQFNLGGLFLEDEKGIFSTFGKIS
jgi:hypothetical protein